MNVAMAHVIEVFTAGCLLCGDALDMVEVGKCASCTLVERDMTRSDPVTRSRIRAYDVRVVPMIVIDGRVKVEGRPDFPWMCGDEFYARLEKDFPLHRPRYRPD